MAGSSSLQEIQRKLLSDRTRLWKTFFNARFLPISDQRSENRPRSPREAHTPGLGRQVRMTNSTPRAGSPMLCGQGPNRLYSVAGNRQRRHLPHHAGRPAPTTRERWPYGKVPPRSWPSLRHESAAGPIHLVRRHTSTPRATGSDPTNESP